MKRNETNARIERKINKMLLTLTRGEGGVGQALSMGMRMRMTRWNGCGGVWMGSGGRVEDVGSCGIRDRADVTAGSGRRQLLSQPGPSIAEPHLDPSLG